MPEINNAWVVKQQTAEGGWVTTHWFPMEIITTINGDSVPERNQFDIGEARAALQVHQHKQDAPERDAIYQKVHDSNAPDIDTQMVYIAKTYGSWQ